MKDDISLLTDKVKDVLSDILGAEPDDIETNQSFTDELMMSVSEIADFIHALEKEGLNIKNINMSEIDNLDELIDVLSTENII